jgi:hypothetical protein
MFEWHITIITQMKKRNSYFKGTPVILPDPLPQHRPIAGFKHLRPERNILLPKVTLDQVEAYYFTLYMISLSAISQLVMAEI